MNVDGSNQHRISFGAGRKRHAGLVARAAI